MAGKGGSAAGAPAAGSAGAAGGSGGSAGAPTAGNGGAAAGNGGAAAGNGGSTAGASGGATAGAGGGGGSAAGAAGSAGLAGGSAGSAGSSAGSGGSSGGPIGGGGSPAGSGGSAGISGNGGAAAGISGNGGAAAGISGNGGAAAGSSGNSGNGGAAAGTGGDGGTGGGGAAAGEGGSGGSAAGNSGNGGAAGVGGGGSAGAGGTSIELDSPADLALLTDLYPALHQTLSVSGGQLSMSAVPVSGGAWYSDHVAPLLYLPVTGDFVAETSLVVGSRADLSMPPVGGFNQAGFVVRDPSTSSPGGARWIMYNIGMQQGAMAREAKTTRPGAPDSLSTLYVTQTPGGARAVRLRVCRLGDVVRMFHRHPGESAFVEEAFDGTTFVQGNGSAEATPGVVLGGAIRFQRPDLGPTLQVGLMVGNWGAPYDVSAAFDYLRVSPAASLADCTADP